MMHKKPTWFNVTKTTWIATNLFLLLFLSACKNEDTQKKRSGQEREKVLFEQYALLPDTLNRDVLSHAVKELNCLCKSELRRNLVFAENYNSEDSSQILVVPFRSLLGDMSSCAYSGVKSRFILISPTVVSNFNHLNTLNDSTSLPAVISLILLHELGHFALGKEGAYDVPKKEAGALGQQKMNTEPEYLTSLKRVELAADSIGASWVKRHAVNTKDMDCLSVASAVELVLPGMQFQLFGTGILDHFGTLTPRVLRDPSNTHPNLELRIAFMNYYLARLPEQKKMIDDYLYNREIAPVERQQTDPRIFQGMEKKLSTE